MPKSHVQSSENQDFHKIWCWLYRTVRPAVEAESTTLFPVLEFVFDRTLACGKTWEVIRLFQFSENLTLHRNTISRNIKRLIALGVILTRNPKHGRAIYAINLNWTDTNMMKTPKRGRTEAPVIPLSEIGRMAAEKAAEAKKKKQRKLSFDAVSSLWASTVVDLLGREAFIAPTKTNYMALFSYAKRFTSEGKTFSDFKDFLTWAIGRWQLIMRDTFRWTKNTAPKVPSIGWLVKFSAQFEEAYLLYLNPVAGKNLSGNPAVKPKSARPRTVEPKMPKLKPQPPKLLRPSGGNAGIEELPEWR